MARWMMGALLASICIASVQAQTGIVKSDTQIDGLDPGIKIFLREKMAQGNTRFANDNVILFLHGATAPSTEDKRPPSNIDAGKPGAPGPA